MRMNQVYSCSESPLKYTRKTPDALEKSKAITTFLTILEVTQILCSFISISIMSHYD